MCECVVVASRGGGLVGDPIEMGGMWSRRRGRGVEGPGSKIE